MPPASRSTLVSACGGKWRNSSAVCAKSSSTVSSMRSWSRAAIVARSAADKRRLPASSRKATPRSMRSTASRPLFAAMSVAFDDHGEMVPTRGVTRKSSPPPVGRGRLFALLCQQHCQLPALACRSARCAGRRSASSRQRRMRIPGTPERRQRRAAADPAERKDENAAAPRRNRISAMAGGLQRRAGKAACGKDARKDRRGAAIIADRGRAPAVVGLRAALRRSCDAWPIRSGRGEGEALSPAVWSFRSWKSRGDVRARKIRRRPRLVATYAALPPPP
jgi:hypothetical protein